MSYYLEPDSHIRYKVKLILNLSNYATKKIRSWYRCWYVFFSINKLVNVPTSLKAKVDELDVGKWKIIPVDLRKLSDVTDNEVVKNTKFNTLKTKLNTLENKSPDATTLIHINQYNTDKQNLEEKIGDADKKPQMQVV